MRTIWEMAHRSPDVVAAIERASHQIAAYLSHELADLGVGQAEAHVLVRLAQGATSPNELHRLFGHKRSTLTSVLDRLESRGYSRREIHPEDRRSFLISLTEDGKTAAATAAGAVDRLQQKVTAATSPSDRAGLAAVVAALDGATSSGTGHVD
jgi:DNA-binding MarR family transcriptional regulator